MTLFAILRHPPPPFPPTQSESFGVNTRVGCGGSLLQYNGPNPLTITAGNSSGHWQIDARNMLVPRNGANAYGTAPPAFSGPYVLTISDGVNATDVTVNIIAAAAHVREMAGVTPNGDSSSVNQLRSLIIVAQGAAGALKLGDTIYCRDGTFNPGCFDWRWRPPAPVSGACYATGSGGWSSNTRIRVISETIDPTDQCRNGFRIGKIDMDTAVSGNAQFPFDWVSIQLYANTPAPQTSMVSYVTGQGFGMGFYNCRIENGPLVTNPNQTDGMRLTTNSTVNACRFVNMSKCITATGSSIFTNNIMEGRYDDAFGLTNGTYTVEDNFMYNCKHVTGSHTDSCQQNGASGSQVFGSYKRNISLRGVGTTNAEDAQGLFCGTTPVGSSLDNVVAQNNIHNLTLGNQFFFQRCNNPTVQWNSALQCVSSGYSGANPSSITVNTGGVNGAFERNLSNVLSIAPQGGTVTNTLNITKSALLATYNTLFAAYTESGLDTRAKAIAVWAPRRAGPLMNVDGTYSGALFPADDLGVISWNDGTVFDPAAIHTPAT